MKLYILIFLEHKVIQSLAQSYPKINFQLRDTLCPYFAPLSDTKIIYFIDKQNISELRNFSKLNINI